MVLSNIRIQGFRGLKNLRISKMGKITVFVGRNNVGKSACLEAICLLLSGKNEFNDALGNDLIKRTTLSRSRDSLAWKYLIHKDYEKAIISSSGSNASTNKNGAYVVVSSEFERKKIEESAWVNFVIKNKTEMAKFRYHDIDERHIEVSNTMTAHYRGKSDSVAKLFSIGRRVHKVAASSTNHNDDGSKTLFLPNIYATEVDLHDMVAKTTRLHKSLSSLSAKISNFMDLRKVEDHLRIFYNDGSSMPFFTLGDGIKASVIATLAINAVNDGTIIMEEPENFLHPGLLNNLISELVLAANSHSAQIFLSTHSIELLEHLLERDSDVSVVQLNELDGVVEARVMDRNSAREQIEELGIDLRGV